MSTPPPPPRRRVRFQAGGALGEGALYVERAADEELPEALRRGEFCYVLATRQIGKSSLRLRTMKLLTREGFACVTIDLTALGTENTTPETWYVGLTAEIAIGLDLDPPDEFWERNKTLGPVHAFSRYIEEEVLKKKEGRIIVFIDEIDATLSLPFARDDFFAAVRAFYNRRPDRPQNERLTFCLLGVAAPGDLISDPTRTPFNIGRGIRLEDFSAEEAALLGEGLEGTAEERAELLKEILGWTSGHPYMTQRVCDAFVGRAAEEGARGQLVEEVVRDRFLERGRTEDPNLQYAERWFGEQRMREAGSGLPKMLRLYRRLLAGETIVADGADAAQLRLRLTGLAAERDQGKGARRLEVRSRIFATVFDAEWVRGKEAGRVIAEPLTRWVESGRKEGSLIGGDALRDAQIWAEGREDLNADERFFLQACERAEQEKRRRAQQALARVLILMISLLVGALGVAIWQTMRATTEANRANMLRIVALADNVPAEGSSRRLLLSVESYRIARRLGVGSAGPSVQALGEALRAMRGYHILAGHTGAVRRAVFSPDGKHVVTASDDATARLWNADGTGEPVVLRGHASLIYAVAFSPDGKHVVTASADKTARVWNVDGMGEPVVLRGHTGELTSVMFSPDSKHVVTASDDATARVWNVDGTGEPVVLRSHTGRVESVAFSPDGERILTVITDLTASIWNADGTGEPVVLHGHEDSIWSAQFSPDGKRVVTASVDKTVRIWNADGVGEPVVLRGHESAVTSAQFSPDGKRVVTSSMDKTVRIWNADGAGDTVVLRGHEDWVRSAAFSPDGKRVVTACPDKTARVWNADGTGEPVVLRGHDDAVTSAGFSGDGRSVVTASLDKTARVWDVDGTGEFRVLRGHAKGVWAAAFSADGRSVVTASRDKTARIWNADGTGDPVVLRGHTDQVLSAAFSPDGQSVVTASLDETARIWNADGTGEPVVLRNHTDQVLSAAFSPDSKRVVTASFDETARIWNADGTDKIVVLHGHRETVVSAAFSADGRYVVTASLDKTARIWNADGTGKPVVLRGHEDWVRSAAFSPDGQRVVTASEDGTARIWNADGTGKPVVLRGHEAGVVSAVFSPDGQRVITASNDKTARIWSADGTGEPVMLLGHEDSVWSAAFSPDGQRVITASEDGTARIWSIDSSTLVKQACYYARRNLTRKEWSQYMPGEAYRTTCPEWPEDAMHVKLAEGTVPPFKSSHRRPALPH